MKASLSWLLPLALWSGAGCVEDELAVRRPAESVRVANREPGVGCRLLDTLEVTSLRSDLPGHAALTAYAAARNANYVTIDTFNVYVDEESQAETLTRARLFACPMAQLAYSP
jgi:hypothetical protein